MSFQVGDRVRYTGEFINEAWDPDRVGTIFDVASTGRISIRWDHGANNYYHDPEHFTVVRTPEEQLLYDIFGNGDSNV